MSAIGSILSNDGALKALNSLRTSSNTTNTLEAQLSSGKKINSPADNPAGYITAEGFTSQLNGLNQALSNANQGISLLQTAQGAINQQTSLLQKMNSIAVQASNGTQTPSESQSLENVVGQLTSQVNSIANQTQFNNINLLNGSFSGVSFQTGANNGQTTTLSIAGTQANNIGMNASQINTGTASSALYAASASGTGVLAGSASAALTNASGAGAFATGSINIKGSNGSASINVGATTESAASIAQSVNSKTDQTNVSAQAKTQVTLSGIGASSTYSINLGNGKGSSISNKVTISAQGRTAFINAINNHTATTGITAKQGSGSNVVLTQSSGKNIAIKNTGSAALSTKNGASIASSGSGAEVTIQGKVSFQSDAGFALGSSASNIGLQTHSKLSALSNINVSTTSGAQKAINVIKYALQKLGAEGGKLGAVQQRLQANVNNNQTTTQNLTSARSVVQDANIPKVSQELTQQQVLQQAGISALKNSTTLQQQYQRLLP